MHIFPLSLIIVISASSELSFPYNFSGQSTAEVMVLAKIGGDSDSGESVNGFWRNASERAK